MSQFRKPNPLKSIFRKEKKIQPDPAKPQNVQQPFAQQQISRVEQLTSSLAENEKILRQIFANCTDIVFRPVSLERKNMFLLVYVDGLVDTKVLDDVVLKPWIYSGTAEGLPKQGPVGEVIEQQLIAVSQVKKLSEFGGIVESICKANVAVFAEGSCHALLADLKGFERRSVEEPSAEIAVRGPRDGFTETLRINTALLRRRLQSPLLKMESYTIGTIGKNDLVVAYLEGIVQDSILQEVRQRLDSINIDGVLGSGYIEEFIEDDPFSPFPQIQNTERPDVVAASLLEGKIAIFVDGTPFVLVLPMVFWTSLQAAEDYYERFLYTTFIRFIRMFMLNVSLFLPSLYVAITTFHPQLIPTSLLISIAAAREGVPFPAMVEAFAMEFTFEGLREAGVRLPKPVGSAVSIVGALVIGQAAVQAGIVSAPMVIIVAATGISSFGIPRYNMGTAFRMLRFLMLFVAGMFGFYGIAILSIAILIHLVNLRSFGVPYLGPVAPQIPESLKDVFIRAPRWSMHNRPTLFSGVDKKRIPEGQKPKPEESKPKV